MTTSNLPAPKNVLLILVDQERVPMHMPESVTLESLPGHKWLRDHGVTFKNYHVNTAPCTPSRSVIFTGWHTARNGMTDNLDFPWTSSMNPEHPTLGDMAAEAGYYPVYKGKWHLSAIEQTFPDEAAGTTRQTTEDAMVPYGFNEYQHDGDLHSSGREGHTHDDKITSAALYWLNEWVNYPKEENAGKPFFLVVGLVNPHDVMAVDVGQGQPEGADEQLMAVMTPPAHAIYAKDHGAALPPSWSQDFVTATEQKKPSAHAEADIINSGLLGRIERSAEEQWTSLVNYYINCHDDVDRNIKRLLDYLVDTGLDKSTIVIFTADHGELAGAHGMRNKGPYIYRENNHVPLVICHPDYSSNHGKTSAVLASALDIAPTVKGLCGNTGVHEHLYGADLSEAVKTPEWAGPAREGILYTYTSLSSVDSNFVLAGASIDPTKRGLFFGIQTREWKFARYFSPADYGTAPVLGEELTSGKFELELYRADDPDEITNLAYEKGYENVLMDLNAKLNDLVAQQLADTQWDPLAGVTGTFTVDPKAFRARYR